MKPHTCIVIEGLGALEMHLLVVVVIVSIGNCLVANTCPRRPSLLPQGGKLEAGQVSNDTGLDDLFSSRELSETDTEA